MLSISYTIAVLMIVLALPYLIAIWNIRHTTMRCMRLESANAKNVPEHLKPIFKEAIAELQPHGFKMVSCHQIEVGPEKDEKHWGIVLQHSSGQTYTTLMNAAQLVNSAAPLTIMFITLFEDKTRLTTVNTPNFGIYSPPPQDISIHAESIAISEQWHRHQQKLAELSQTKQTQILPATAFLKALQAFETAYVERLVKLKEVRWAKPKETFQMTWRTAIRAVYRVARQRKPLPSKQPNVPIATSTSSAATPIIELEIAEFHRLQQKQQKGISQRNKNWLLLGTLALFVASYSSVFEPQKLLIFVAVLLLHEGGHVLAMKLFGYRNTMMLFIPFLGALATARKENASLTEKVWISLAGPLPGLVLGIGLAIAFGTPNVTDPNTMTAWFSETNWVRETSWMLIILNLFNLLPVYPLDGGQVADLLLFSRNPYLGVVFKGIGVLLLGLLGLTNPLMLGFALLIAITIPNSFRLAKLNTRFRKDLKNLPHSDRDGLLQFLFTQLQAPPYQSLPFIQKYNLVVGLLDVRKEETAKWHVRTGLAGIYLVSLLTGLAGGLYALIPNWTAWVAVVGGIVNSQGHYRYLMEQEITAANQAIQANPQDEEAYVRRGRARLVLDDNEGAIADANEALKINPNAGEAYQLRGLVRGQLGDSAGATADQEKGMELLAQQQLEELNQILSQNPNEIEAYLSRANLYMQANRYQDAIADCNRALLIEPQNIWAVLSRGETYLRMNKYPEAIGNANHALRLDPNSGDAYEFRSRVRRQMGDEAGAIADIQKAEILFQTYEDEL